MSRSQQSTLARSLVRSRVTRTADRRGSTFFIVIAMLALLSLLGVVAYSFSVQESSNAEYFSEAAKDITDPGLDADVLFDWALEQLIVGPNDRYYNSALWGRRHSLLTNMFGYDLHPFDGEGVNVALNATNGPIIDQQYNNDGNPSGDASFINFNDAPAARGGTLLDVVADRPAPDVDYTYPDINSLFLSYDGSALDTSNNPSRVIIPSFHRPQYLRDSTGVAYTDWYQNSNTAARVMRPHTEHVYMSPDGTAPGVKRFITPSHPLGTPLDSGDFPMAVEDGGDGGIAGEMGVWSGAAANFYELDVDNDGDSVKEGIWLDLDFPVQEDAATGKLFVPIFSYTVIDLDGLLNLNIHGDIARMESVGLSSNPFGDDKFLSPSNGGLSPGEVSPLWALNGRPETVTGGGDLKDTSVPSTAFSTHQNHFGHLPWPHSGIATPPTGPGADWREIANMEWWFLNTGRAKFGVSGSLPNSNIDDIYAGRWGEIERTYQTLSSSANPADLPKPGRTDIDDNQDLSEGGASGSQPAFVHPLPYNGSGRYVKTTGNGRAPDLYKPDANKPNTWLRYTNYELAGNVSWDAQTAGLISAPFASNQMLDDAMEIIVDSKRSISPYDEILPPDEQAFLFLTNTDFSNTGEASRLKELFPFNFGDTDNNRAASIRKKFTVLSWDRKQFGLPQFTGKRAWEFSADADGDGKQEFPPRFGTVTPYTEQDPFRPALRKLLETENNNQSDMKVQMRLSLNQLLTLEGDVLKYRPLTPHPSDTSITAAQIPAVNPFDGEPGIIDPPTSPVAYPPTPSAPWDREYWARQDRQKMARDIYVLLYTLGGGSDGINYCTASNPYSDKQCEEMAQFAVNVVDNLDRDDRFTQFEYDKNLANGWNLDDDPFTDDGVGDREIVRGVERQSLCFSEGLLIRTKLLGSGDDHKATLYDEESRQHIFMFVELRNVAPFNEQLAQTVSDTADKGIWRLRRDDNDYTVTFLKDLSGIAAGDQWVMATSDGDDTFSGGERRPADFRVNHNTFESDGADDTFELIAPNHADGFAPKADSANDPSEYWPQSDLDLVHKRDTSGVDRFQLDSMAESNLPGTFIHQGNFTGSDITLILERRLDPELPNAGTTKNPWVAVDRITIPVKEFGLDASDTTEAAVAARLAALESVERAQPISRDQANFITPPVGDSPILPARARGDSIHFNTLSDATEVVRNSRSPNEFNIAQVHFDRDYGSVMELLTIPLYGPGDLTKFIYAARKAPYQEFEWTLTNPYVDDDGRFTLGDRARPLEAGTMFLQPQHNRNLGEASPDPQIDSRWYRLLELVEVPTRTQRQLGSPFEYARVPGKINLNTVRNPSVLMGLLDDTDVNGFDMTDPHNPKIIDQAGEAGREWWQQFIESRDRGSITPGANGIDPTTGLYLPGMPHSRPFRSLAFMAQGNDSADHTILRRMPLDGDDTGAGSEKTNRRLFELGTQTQHDLGSISRLTRHRMLSKIAGNTTTRSNAFAVFISVDFFEAYEDTSNGAIRIGGKLIIDESDPDLVASTRNELYRGFFIVDRSDAEEAFDSATGRFDWRKLVKHRLTLDEE